MTFQKACWMLTGVVAAVVAILSGLKSDWNVCIPWAMVVSASVQIVTSPSR